MKGAQVVLTVSEGKRLIAKGLAAFEPVRRALESGTVAVCKGTTNSYVVEELLGTSLEKTKYVSGNVRPAKGGTAGKVSAEMPDLVLSNGEPVEGVTAVEAVSEMGPGDIFLKGASAINYGVNVAALLIGHATGGTLGAAMGTLVSRRVRLVVPVGLEKEVAADLFAAAARVGEAGRSPALWAFSAELFTEVEALEALADVEAVPIAAGGIGGAEGSVRLLVTGEDEEVGKAVEIVKSIQGEPPFLNG